jgi:hypothetical protein
MKTCSRCGKEKDDGEFRKSRCICRDCRLKANRTWYAENKQYQLSHQKEYREDNKQKIAEINRIWYESNRDAVISKKKDRKASDGLFRLRNTLSSLIANAMSRGGYRKTSRVADMLGCSFEQLVAHLGPKPEGDAHVDHICPCSQAVDVDDMVKLQHYINLQWLSAEDNLRKSDNRTPEAEDMCRKLLNREWIDK